MQNLRIATVQANQIWEDKEANYSNYLSLLQSVEDVDLIILPEMFNTCFSMNTELLAEEFEDSAGITFLKNLSIEKNAAVCTSLIIKEAGKNFNRMVFIQPNGSVNYYDKNKLFTLAKEDESFSKGTKKLIINYKGFNILLQVCYDLRFTNLSNNIIDEKGNPEYDLAIYVANWPEKRAHHWKSLLVSRAIENQAYVIGVNRVGEDGNGFTYSGDSAIIDANGEYVTEHQSGEESVEISTISLEELSSFREKLPFLKDK